MLLRLLCITALLLLSLCGYAQDKIYPKKGSVIDAWIKEIGTKTITCQRTDGPLYEVLIEDIDKIQFANGREMYTKRDQKGYYFKEGVKHVPKYGDHIISITPVTFAEKGWHQGLAYERALDKAGNFSLYVPVALTRYNDREPMSLTRIDNIRGKFAIHQRRILSVAPGIKIYPTSNKGIIKYAMAPSLYLAAGYQDVSLLNRGPILGPTRLPVYYFGALVSNSMNINTDDHFYIALENNFGVCSNNIPKEKVQRVQVLLSFGFRLGYRF